MHTQPVAVAGRGTRLGQRLVRQRLQDAAVAGRTGDLALVASTIDISRRTYAKMRQNLFWACVYNVVGIPLAAAGLLNPVIAGAAMAFSSVSVVSNALLLRRWRPVKLG